MGKSTLTRKELYDLVWSTPLNSLAKQLEITPARIKSICKEKKITLPDPGFWEKMKHGKDVQISELPMDNSYWVNVPIYITPTEELSRNRIKRIRIEIERTCKRFLKVPAKLSNPDRLVLEAQHAMQNNKSYWYGREEGYISTGDNHIPIFVTPKNIKRSLRLVDAFIKLARARDHVFEIDNYKTQIVIDEEKYDFALREKQNRVKNLEREDDYRYESSGLLVISVGQYSRKREFTDGSQPLEKQLSTILAYLEDATAAWKKSMAESEVRQKIREEQEQILLEARKKEQEEREKFRKLIRDANRWQQAKLLYKYIQAVEDKAKGMNNDNSITQDWVEWAKNKVEMYDPLNCQLGFGQIDSEQNDQ